MGAAPEELCPGDIWMEAFDDIHANQTGRAEAFANTMKRRQFALSADAPPLEVESAFGGLGIYKVASVLRSICEIIAAM